MDTLISNRSTRVKTAYYTAVLSAPIFIAFCGLTLSRGNTIGFAINFCIFLSLVTLAISIRKNVMRDLHIYIVAFIIASALLIAVKFDVSNLSNVLWFLCVPPLSILCLGTRIGSLLGVLFLLFFAYFLFSEHIEVALMANSFRIQAFVSYLVILTVTILASYLGDEYLKALRVAKKRIEDLEKMLPMCMHCKMVNVGGRWQQVEQYLMDEAEVVVSHGLCKNCAERHYK